MRRSKILCTLGPASSSPEMLRALVAAGMDAVRLNFSHGTLDDHRRTLALVRGVADELGRPLSVLQDLQGPKIRVGQLGPAGRELTAGQEVLLTTVEQGPDAAAGALPVSYPQLPGDVGPGAPLLLDDGLLRLEVLAVESPTLVRAKVIVGGHLSSHKGINLPNVALSTPSLTAKDREDLAAGLAMGVDWVALSFVRTAADVRELRSLIEAAGSSAKIVAKIEKPEALGQLEAILAASDGIMVARGDLAVEVSPQRVPLLQRQMVELANRAGKLVIIATQMLDSMMRNPTPTRAEVTDVAWAVMLGADATMLSGETAVGAFPCQTVQMMSSIIEEVETGLALEGRAAEPRLIPELDPRESAIGRAAVQTAGDLGTACIAAFSRSGRTAGLISDYRPRQPVLAFTYSPEVYRRLGLLWGVTPLLLAAEPLDLSRAGQLAEEHARRLGLVQPGQSIVITFGHPANGQGVTNLVLVQRVE